MGKPLVHFQYSFSLRLIPSWLSYILIKMFVFAKRGIVWVLLLVLGAIAPLSSRARDALTADEIISKAVAHAQEFKTRERPASYSYTKLTLTEEFDAAGNIKERKERMYQVILQDGATHLKLIAVNG